MKRTGVRVTLSETKTYAFLLGFYIALSFSYCPFTKIQRDFKKKITLHQSCAGRCEELRHNNIQSNMHGDSNWRAETKITETQGYKDSQKDTGQDHSPKKAKGKKKVESWKYTGTLTVRHRWR